MRSKGSASSKYSVSSFVAVLRCVGILVAKGDILPPREVVVVLLWVNRFGLTARRSLPSSPISGHCRPEA